MLKIHFLNVGHGDCTIIEPPSGRLTMVDINTSQEYDAATRGGHLLEDLGGLGLGARGVLPIGGGPAALLSSYLRESTTRSKERPQPTDPVAYMKRVFPGRRLWRFVLSHPDLDHMRGLARLDREIGFDNFWDTANEKATPDFRSLADREDWMCYQAIRNTACCRIFTRAAAAFAFNRDEFGLFGGDGIEILSPTPALAQDCNRRQCFNDISIVLRVAHAGRTFLLAGDAEEAAWDDMVRHYGWLLKSDVLKAAHHGRDSGYHMEAVRHIAPLLAVLSVGGRPETDASAKYRRFSERVATTRRHGDIQVHVHDNGDILWFPSHNREPGMAPCP